jgi:hypothetical protein
VDRRKFALKKFYLNHSSYFMNEQLLCGVHSCTVQVLSTGTTVSTVQYLPLVGLHESWFMCTTRMLIVDNHDDVLDIIRVVYNK